MPDNKNSAFRVVAGQIRIHPNGAFRILKVQPPRVFIESMSINPGMWFEWDLRDVSAWPLASPGGNAE